MPGTRLKGLLDWWIRGVTKRPHLAVLVSLVAASGGLYVAVTELGINTDTAEMLSEELPFRQVGLRYEALFPASAKDLLVVVDASTPELASRAVDTLVARLAREPDVIREAELPEGEGFFRRFQLLYRNVDELSELESQLFAAEPFLRPVFENPTPRGLVAAFAEAFLEAGNEEGTEDETDDPVERDDLPEHLYSALREISASVESFLEGDPYEVSWVTVFDRDGMADRGRRRFVAVEPVMNHDRFLPAGAAIERIRMVSADLEQLGTQRVRIRITGRHALEHEELEGLSRSTAFAGLFAMGGVCLTLLIALGSYWMTFSTLLTLGAGLSLSAGFAALAVGDLNMISLAFAVLYIGLGVDFAIHYALRFRERMSGETTAPEAVRLAAADVGPALSLCAATTALGFFAFVPTAYAGVAELGLISGTSMFIGLVLSFTLLPGLLQIGPTPTPRHSQPALWRRWVAEPLARLPSRKGRPIRWISLTVAVASLLLLSRASFDFNPNNMRDPASESVTTFEDLLADPDAAPWTVSVLSDSAGVEGTVAALERLESVLEVRTVASFVPREQEPKLAILDRLAERFPDRAPPPGRITEGDLEDQVQAIRDLRDLTSFAASRTEGELSTTLGVLSRRLRRLLTALEARDPVTQASTLTSFNDLLLAGWSATMNDLFDSFRVAQLTSDNLPDEVNRQWVGGEGTRRLQVVPVEDLSDPSAMRRFVHDIFNVTTEATDLPVSYVEAGREIVRAFRLAFLGALGAIFLVLLLVLRRPDSVLLVLLPLGLAALVAGGITVLLGISFNFANIIVLPLLFGLGVDNGVHIFHRIRSMGTGGRPVLLTSTARGVVFSGITTVVSFSSLAFTPHRGIASMGVLLAIGVLLIQLFTLIVLPAFLVEESAKS